jgi:hypothetical protein
MVHSIAFLEFTLCIQLLGHLQHHQGKTYPVNPTTLTNKMIEHKMKDNNQLFSHYSLWNKN